MNSGLQRDIRVVRVGDHDYPAALREIHSRPEVLYVIGRWPLPQDKLLIGIVGSRRATPNGLDATTKITMELVTHDVVTVSGMAAGIDAAAHRATLAGQGWSIGVLGHGFGHLFPRENKNLFEKMGKEGTLVTEFAYDTSPLPAYFPQRNRIISGLSKGVIVVEAGAKSGALITAKCAAEQGRDVFAVPGSILRWQCEGSNSLIKEGAKVVTGAQDVLAEYQWDGPSVSPVAPDLPALTEDENSLLQNIQNAPISIDELVEMTSQRVDRLAELLLSLELKGRISMMPGQQYVARY